MTTFRLVSGSAGLLLAIVGIGGQGAESPAHEPKAVLVANGPGVNGVAFSLDGKTIAVACQSGDVELWEVGTYRRRTTFRGHSGSVQSVAFRGDGRLLASCDSDGTIRLWDLPQGKAKTVLQACMGCVSSIAFSPDGKLLASGGGDKSLRIWDVSTGCLKATLKGRAQAKDTHTQVRYSVMAIAFSGDGKLLAAGGADGTVKLWDVVTSRLKATLVGSSSEGVSSVAFSGDSKLLAAGNYERLVELWDLATGEVKVVLKGHRYAVSSVAFSPDGKLLASVSGDGLELEEWEEPPEPLYEIKLWDVATGREKASLAGETGQMWSVAFSPNGKFLATGDWADIAFQDGPGRVRLWEVQALLNLKR